MKFFKGMLSITVAIVAIISSNAQGAHPGVVKGTPVYGSDVVEGTPVYGDSPDVVRGNPAYGINPDIARGNQVYEDTVKGTPVYGTPPVQKGARQTRAARGTPLKVNK
jgi:hypothetical protein